MEPIKALEGKWTMLVGDEALDPEQNTVFEWRDGHLFEEGEDGGPIEMADGMIVATLADDVFLQIQVPDEPATADRLDGYLVTEIEENVGGDLREIAVLTRHLEAQAVEEVMVGENTPARRRGG